MACEIGPAVQWKLVQDLLDTSPPPKNKKPATFSEAFRQEFLTEPEILANLVRNLRYGPAKVLHGDGTPVTGAELETRKEQIKGAIAKLLSQRFFKAVYAGNPGEVFQAIQERLEPKFRGYMRLGMDVYLGLQRSGLKDITIKLFREAVFRECRRLDLPKPTHFRRDILLPCGLGNLGKARPGPKLANRETK